MRKIPETTIRRVLERVRQAARPLLVGPLAVELGCSLREAEHIVENLVVEGRARPLTDRELTTWDLRFGFALV